MKSSLRNTCFATVLATSLFCTLNASASSYFLDSNSSTVLYAGSTGTATTPTSFGNQTFNLGTGNGVWASPIGDSNWVSFNPSTAPDGTYTAPAGNYYYFDFFTAQAIDQGSITVLADDTTSIYLNGIAITNPASFDGGAHCTQGVPNCETASTFLLPTGDFVDGQNVLSFGVEQLFGTATGLDFEATIDPPSAAAPEPGSIFMLGTGLLSAAGLVRRRIVA